VQLEMQYRAASISVSDSTQWWGLAWVPKNNTTTTTNTVSKQTDKSRSKHYPCQHVAKVIIVMIIIRYDTIRYDTRRYIYVRSKA